MASLVHFSVSLRYCKYLLLQLSVYSRHLLKNLSIECSEHMRRFDIQLSFTVQISKISTVISGITCFIKLTGL